MIKLEKELNYIEEELINMASVVTEMLYESIKALKDFDTKKCERVIEEDEKVDNIEIEIESKVIRAIALYQPEGEILRKLVMAIKINKDFERIGDHSVNIASNILKTINLGKVEIPEEIEKIFNIITIMINKTMRAFVDHNSNLAKEVIEMDKEIDSMRDKGIRKIIEESKVEKDIEKTLLLILTFKDLERIGDLLTNICEGIVYIVEGKIVEHKYK
ncbi:MAG: phosphate signaling complex protein PhoU [Brevinematia bacterium]